MAQEATSDGPTPDARVRQEWSSDRAYGLAWTLSQLWRARELLWALATRSIKGRYKQSLLGIAWAIVQPFAMMVIFTIVFSKFAKVDTGDTPYPVFSYAALLPWQLFSGIITKGSSSVLEYGSIVKKLYFPREICVLSTVLSALVDFAVASVMLLVLMLIYHVPPSVYMLWLPLVLVIMIVFALGITLFFSAVNVFYRDISFGMPLVLQVWMYLSPVAYPISSVPERYRALYMWNPMAPVIDNFRRVLVERAPVEWAALWPAAVIAVLSLVIGYWHFKRVEGTFADVL